MPQPTDKSATEDRTILTAHRDGFAPSTMPIADRTIPTWMSFVAFTFSATTGICWLAIALLSVFFQDIVTEQGNSHMAKVLVVAGLFPVLGLIIIDIAQAAALSGFKYARTLSEIRAKGILGGLLVLVLMVVHPALILPAALGTLFAVTYNILVDKRRVAEPSWSFSAPEAASVLAGRDFFGLSLALEKAVEQYRFSSSLLIGAAMTTVFALAVSSWLAANEVLATSATLAVVILSVWAMHSISRYLEYRKAYKSRNSRDKAQIERLPPPETDEDSIGPQGLSVHQLSISTKEGTHLLKSVSISIAPGNVTGIIGSSASGKSLLLRAICSPFDLEGLRVKGHVTYNEEHLWSRSRNKIDLPCVYLPSTPLLLRASGHDNLTCYNAEVAKDRVQRVTEQMVYSTDIADRIIKAPDARTLSMTDQKALGFARGFLMNPGLYLMDRPEDGASKGLIAALVEQIRSERRAGRSFVIATDERSLLELCDQIIVMENGRVIDMGPATDIRLRMSEGWARFVTKNTLESEDALHLWLRSHFRRKGDEANRRKVCIVASELLALCAASQHGTELQDVTYDFKHFKGYCQLELTDSFQPVSNAQLAHAQSQLDQSGDKLNRDPISEILRHSLNFDQRQGSQSRTISVQIQTYDPRLASKSATAAPQIK